jgi:hypothetical protein
LSRQAKQAFDFGRLAEADALLERAKELEEASLRGADMLLQRVQEAKDRHAISIAKLESTQGEIALSQLHHAEGARHYEAAASRLSPSVSNEKAYYLVVAGNALETSSNSAGARTDYANALEIM